MGTKNLNFLLCFFFTTLLRLSMAQMAPAVFVFGDSLVDVGNNNYLPVSISKANFPHNGIDFPNKKPTGRFCNGKNAADFIAEKLGLPSSPPYLALKFNHKDDVSGYMTGVSFASAGAGIFNGTDGKLGQSIPLTQQVGDYESVYGKMVEKMGASASHNMLSKSIFTIVIGSNDVFDYSNTSISNRLTPQEYVDLMVTTLKDLMKRMYDHGGRKFVISGVGPVGCVPALRVKTKTLDCKEEANSMADMYNQRLKSMLQHLNSELKGISYSFFDSYNFLLSIIQNPSKYGFVEAKAACCGLGTLRAKVPCLPISTYCMNRRDHIFWDLYHPTEATAHILVDTFFDGPSQYTFPVNVRKLVTVA